MPKTSTPSEYLVKGKTKDGQEVVVCRIDRSRGTGKYILKPDVPQSDYVSEIELAGFKSLPAGLKRSGAGLTSSNGYLILKTLSDELGSYSLKIDISGKTQIGNPPRFPAEL